MLQLSSGSRIGNFLLDEKLGEGGMGEVWRGHLELVPKFVAIKVIRPKFASDSDFRSRFFREAKAMATLRHDRIIPLENFFEQDGCLVLVMPFVAGQTLDKLIEKHPTGLPADLIKAISADVLSALNQAHEKSIVHRDIKPQNILVSPENHAFLMDFGIAKDLADEGPAATGVGFTIGTPDYMSPEQIRAYDALDGRSDLYSFGCVLYQMATGKRPFVGEGTGLLAQSDLFRKHLEAPVPQVSRETTLLPSELDIIVKKCLQKDRSLRYRSAIELLNHFNRLDWVSQPATIAEPSFYQGTLVQTAPAPAIVGRPPQPAVPQQPVQPPPGFPLSKYLGLACVVGLVAGGAWFLTRETATVPEKKSETKIEKIEVPVKSAPSIPKKPQETPVPPALVPQNGQAQAKMNPAAEALYREAQQLRLQSDFCAAQAKAQEAVDLDARNLKYQKLRNEMKGSC